MFRLMKKLFLFDIDGTILMTYGAGLRGMERAGQELFGPKFSLSGISIAGSLDQKIFQDAVAQAQIAYDPPQYEQFVARYGQELQRELTNPHARRPELLPGITELLEQLRQESRVGLGLLTGNYTLTGPIKLRHLGIDPSWFPVAAWGDLADSRPGLVPLAIDQHHQATGHRLEGQDVVVIGDTPKDIDCAHAHGCLAVAVATGDYDLQTLADAGADIALQDLQDPSPLLALLDA